MTLKEQRDAAIKKQQALRDAAVADGNRAFTADEQKQFDELQKEIDRLNDEIKAEEEDYKNYPLPIYYNFKSTDAKERILYNNFNLIDQEVKDMIKKIQTEFGKSEKKESSPTKKQ